MGACDEAAAQGQRRAMHLIDAEEMEPHAGAGDVDDRVDRAHVVEVHVVDGGPVDARFRLPEPGEDARGVRLDGRGQIAGGDQIEDGAQVSVRVLVPVVPVSVRMAGRITGMIVVVHVHVDLGRPEDALHHLASLERPPGKTELGELVAEGLEGHARVHEGAHDHVPRGPARAVEVRDAHLYRILLASLLIWLACAAAP